MLPVSVTAIILRIIFKLKLADIVINVTSGGPGGATDTVTSFIYREYRDRSNVGYGTMLAMVYLVIIIVFVTLLLKLVSRCIACASDLSWPRRRARSDRTSGRIAGIRSPRFAGRVADLRRADLLGLRLPVPDLLDGHHLVQDGGRRHPGPPDPLRRLQAGLARLALARPVARHDRRRSRRCATSS